MKGNYIAALGLAGALIASPAMAGDGRHNPIAGAFLAPIEVFAETVRGTANGTKKAFEGRGIPVLSTLNGMVDGAVDGVGDGVEQLGRGFMFDKGGVPALEEKGYFAQKRAEYPALRIATGLAATWGAGYGIAEASSASAAECLQAANWSAAAYVIEEGAEYGLEQLGK